MYTYIKQSIPNNFISFEIPLSDEEYNNIGSTFDDYLNNLWVLLNSEQVKFHEDNPNATVEEVWNMKINPKVDQILPSEIENNEEIETPLKRKLREIDEYSDVYSFYLNGKEMWLNKQQRKDIKELISAYRISKEKIMTKWIDNIEYTFTLNQWIKIIQQIKVYENKIENVKNTHKKNVSELQDNIEIENYVYTIGYPEKLNIEIQ